jgi:ketosteroid isomerase-like protein
MSQENFEVVRQLIAALNQRDVDRYLSLCTRDIDLNTPTTPLDGETRGPEGIRKFFAAVEEASTTFHIEVERMQTIDGDRVYELLDGKVCRVDVYHDRKRALEDLGLAE